MTSPAHQTIPGSERSFGLSVGGVLCAIAAALLWRHRPIRAEVIGGIGAALVLFGAVAPSVLKWPRIWWWRIARVVGDFNARVLLTVMFGVLFVPLSLIWRVTGKDPLARRRTKAGWSIYPARYRDRRHFQRMY